MSHVFICADSVLDGRALVERDLIVAADGANRTAVSGAENGAVRRRGAFAADRVVSRGTRTSSAVAVRAQVARFASHDRLLLTERGSVLVPGVKRQRRRIVDALVRLSQFVGDDRLLIADLLVMIAIALALRVVSGVTFALDSTIGRARPARPTRPVTAGRIAECGAAHARLALGRHFFHCFIVFFFFFSYVLMKLVINR